MLVVLLVGDAVLVLVWLVVGEGVLVWVDVGVLVGVLVDVGVAVNEGVAATISVGVGIGVEVWVAVAVDVEVLVLLGVAVGLAVDVGVLVGGRVGVTGGTVAVAPMDGEAVTVWTAGGVPSVGAAVVDVSARVNVGTIPGVGEGVAAGHGVSEAGAPCVGDCATVGTMEIPTGPPGGTM